MSKAAAQLNVQTIWSIVSGATLHWKVWDDDCVVFNAATGQTHVLDPFLALLVRQIDAGRGRTSEIFPEVTTTLGLDLTDEVRNQLEQMLRQLEDFGLVESVVS